MEQMPTKTACIGKAIMCVDAKADVLLPPISTNKVFLLTEKRIKSGKSVLLPHLLFYPSDL